MPPQILPAVLILSRDAQYHGPARHYPFIVPTLTCAHLDPALTASLASQPQYVSGIWLWSILTALAQVS